MVSFIKMVTLMPEVIHKSISAVKLLQVLADLDITFKGKKIDKGFATGVLALIQIVQSDQCMKAFGAAPGCVRQIGSHLSSTHARKEAGSCAGRALGESGHD